MTRATRRTSKGVNDESSIKKAGESGVTAGSSTSTSTHTAPVLRRSTRGKAQEEQSPASSPSTKNVERIKKGTVQTTPIRRKSERLEKLITPSPLGRSDKNGKNSSVGVSGSTNSKKGSSTLGKRKKEEQGGETEQKTKKKSKDLKGNTSKKLSAVTYRTSLLKTHSKRDKKSDKKLKVHNDLPQGEDRGHCGGVKIEPTELASPQNGEISESCIQQDVFEKDIHAVLQRSTDNTKTVEVCETSHEKEACALVPVVRSSLVGEVLKSCSHKDGTEKDIHPVNLRSLESEDHIESSEVLSGGQRKPALVQSVSPSTTDNLVHLELEEDGGGGKLNAKVCGELSGECCTDVQLRGSLLMTDVRSVDNVCVSCKFGGTLLCCDYEGCNKSYHLECLDPPLNNVRVGLWHCVYCVKKKMESGVHSLSGGVESILDSKEVELADSEGVQKQYLVKYRCLAHVHNRWAPESQLLLEAPELVEKFKKNQVVRWKPEWALPQRLLLKRLLMSPKQRAECLGGSHSDTLCHFEWLVKWNGLGYDDATWELESEPFLRSPEAIKLIKDYECRLEKAKMASDPAMAEKVLQERKGSFFKLLEMPGEYKLGLDNDHLCSVNKLREYWHKGQNAVFVEDQERVITVISFILSLQSIVCRPFLIVSTTSALSAWEAGFLRLAPALDVIVYGGSRDARKSIRMLEFSVDGCSAMFQVLLSPPEAIVEDIESLNCISWEAIIVDECQLCEVSKSLENLKLLTTYFKLLLVNGPMKDSLDYYRHLLSFLGSSDDKEDIEYPKHDSNDSVEKLKEKLAWFVASERKSDSSKFVEYWVPVKLSNVQLEQYCHTLLANSAILRSCSKSIETVEHLRNVLISTRKCCDHPYLVDPCLQKKLTDGLPEAEYLDVGVKASGKLQVLDKILPEIKKQGLRVLILFQSIVGSGGISLGSLLDDVVRQRFGEDSYERVDAGLSTSKKQAAINNFNDKKKGRIVFLLEQRACDPSIKLSSVDIVILYDSDWNPYNDLKALQKITIDSRHEQLPLFRLYSSSTLEEKALIHAKQAMPIDSNEQNLNISTIHMLLRWGASHLFKELKEFHDSSPSSGLIISSEQSLLNLVKELSGLLPQEAGSSSTNNSSIVVEVKQTGGIYCKDICLPGEMEMQSIEGDPPHVFWEELHERKIPEWRYLSSASPSQSSCKRVQCFEGSPKITGSDNGDCAKKRRKLDKEGESGSPAGNESQFLESPKVQVDASGSRNVNEVSNEKRSKSLNAPKDLLVFLKPDISKLCDIFSFPGNVKDMAGRFLEYIISKYDFNQEATTRMQAFKISLCWVAASLLEHELDQTETLTLAKQHLNFECQEKKVRAIYEKLLKKKKLFLPQAENVNQSTSRGEPADDARPGQQDLERGEVRATPQLATGSEETNGSLNDEVSKNISLVEKIHSLRLLKLVAYQAKECEEVKQKRDRIEKEEVAKLDRRHKLESALVRRLDAQDSVKSEKLKILDQELNSKKKIIKDCLDSEEIRLKSLHLADQNEETRLKVHWLREAKSGRPVESFSALPQMYSCFKLETLGLSEQGPPKEAITDRIGSLRESATGDAGPSEFGRGKKPEGEGSSVLSSGQLHLRDLEHRVQDPSEEAVTDRTGTLRVNAMGVAGSSGTVRGHEPVVMGSILTKPSDNPVKPTFQSIGPLPCNWSEDATIAILPDMQLKVEDLGVSDQGPSKESIADGTGSLGHSEVRFSEVSETIRGHEQVVQELPMSAPSNPLSEPLLPNSSSLEPLVHPSVMQSELRTPTVSPYEPPESNQSYYHNSVFSHAGPPHMPAPAPLLPNSSRQVHTVMNSVPFNQSRMQTGPPVGSGTRASDTSSMTSSQTYQAPPLPDPLCYVLASLQEERKNAEKKHEEWKKQTNAEYEREMEEIRRKYSKRHHDNDTACEQKKKALNTKFSKVLMNRMLAEVFRFKCAGPVESQQGM